MNQLRCSSGFTSFTPNYPEAESLESIFEAQPLSKFGMALLITFICVYSLAHDKWEMKEFIDRKKIMLDLHALVKRLRSTKRTVEMLKKMDVDLDAHIAELEQTIQETKQENASKGAGLNWFDIKGKTKKEAENLKKMEEKKKNLEEMKGNEETVERMIEQLTGAQKDLCSHQDLIKKRVKANHYAQNYLDNKATTN